MVVALHYLTTPGTYQMTMRNLFKRFFILSPFSKSMLMYQFRIYKQFQIIIYRSPANTEIKFTRHLFNQHLRSKMPLNRIYCIQYGKTFRGFPKSMQT